MLSTAGCEMCVRTIAAKPMIRYCALFPFPGCVPSQIGMRTVVPLSM